MQSETFKSYRKAQNECSKSVKNYSFAKISSRELYIFSSPRKLIPLRYHMSSFSITYDPLRQWTKKGRILPNRPYLNCLWNLFLRV